MRDTSDMMEDAMSEDTMMDCGNDGGSLDDLVNLATDISDSSATIQDAAERLLTLLGVEDSDDDFLSSSEDEGVEIDLEDTEDDEIERPENLRLLHQLANSLAQELKYSQSKNQCHLVTKNSPASGRCKASSHQDHQQIQQIQHMDTSHESSLGAKETVQARFSTYGTSYHHENIFRNPLTTSTSSSSSSSSTFQASSFDECGSRKRFKADEKRLTIVSEDKTNLESLSSSSWDSGWNACAHEAVRYLVEDEGLGPHHPTVLALKNHLIMQRDKAIMQYLV